MDLELRMELFFNWIDRRSNKHLRRIIALLLLVAILATITSLVYLEATRYLGYSFWDTAFWVIVYILAIDRVRLLFEGTRRVRGFTNG